MTSTPHSPPPIQAATRPEVPVWWWLGIAPAVALLLSQWGIGPLVGAGDYAQYLLHAKALAEGRPYSDIGYITTRYSWGVGPAVQPPVFPLLLTPIVKLFGVNLAAAQVMTYATLWGFLALAAGAIGRVAGRWAAIIGVTFTAVAMAGAYATSAPLTDLPFSLMLWLMIFVGDGSRRWTWKTLTVLALIAVVAAGTRVVGAGLVPAVLIAAWLRGPQVRRPAVLASGIALVAGAGAAVLVALKAPTLLYSLGLRHFRLSHLMRRPLEYTDGVMQVTQYPFPGDKLNDAWHVVAVVLLLIGLLTLIRDHWRRMLVVVVVCYGLVLWVAPVATPRYLWPLFPVLGAATAVGLERVLRMVPVVRSREWATGVLLLVATASAIRLAMRPRPVVYTELADVRALFDWARQSDRTRTRVVFESSRVLTLETGVAAMPTFAAPTPAEVQRELDDKGITHVVVGGHIGLIATRDLEMAMGQLSPPWSSVYEAGAFRVLQRPGTGGTP